MLETAARPSPGAIPGTPPAARNTIGTTVAMPAPEAGEAGDADDGLRGEQRGGEPGGRDEAAGADEADGTERLDEPVAHEAPGGHRHGEGGEAERGAAAAEAPRSSLR